MLTPTPPHMLTSTPPHVLTPTLPHMLTPHMLTPTPPHAHTHTTTCSHPHHHTCSHPHHHSRSHTIPLTTYSPFSSPRDITFVVIDALSSQSNPALARVNFEHLDNPPILDLNGETTPGNDFSTVFNEGSSRISVSACVSPVILLKQCKGA